MKNTEAQDKIDGLKDVFEVLHDSDGSALPLVRDEIAYVRDKKFLTGRGAVSDTLTPEGKDSRARRWMQRTLAMLPDSGLVDLNRRTVIRAALGLGSLAGVTAAGTLGVLIANEISKPDAFRDSFVREVLRLHSDRNSLKLWREELIIAGLTDECEFIDAIASHGDGFGEADSAMRWIEGILDEQRLSDFSRKYLQINSANHHRYLGQTSAAFSLMATFKPLASNDLRLNALALNQKYMNRHLVLRGVDEYRIEVPLLNHSLAKAMRDELDIDAASLSLDSFLGAEQISVECLCLKGWFFMNQCISANSENEALSALEVVDEYRSLLVQHFVKHASNQGKDWMAIRLFGEAISNYARIAPVAWVKGWRKVLEGCFNSFYSSGRITDPIELAAMRSYHEDEKRELRSPIWIQMALVRTMADEVADGNGARTLIDLLPATERYDIRRHTVLQRSLDALRVAFGRDPREISELNTLVSVDDHLMLAGVQMMMQRRVTRFPI